MKLTHGATRFVLLAFGLAIKFPRFLVDDPWAFSRAVFREGRRANLLEREWSSKGYPQLCPVYLSDPFGLFVIMPRCEPAPPLEPYAGPASRAVCPALWAVWPKMPVDNYAFNYGLLKGRLVSFDYGSEGYK